MRLSGNSVLITGGATGIGYAMAEAFLAAGSAVAICGRRKRRLQEAQAQHPVLRVRVCDVEDADQRRDLAEWIAAEAPGLNVLVNNAGVQRDVDFSGGIGEFLNGENEIRVDLEAPIILSGMLIPRLARQSEAAIINVSSGLGFVPAARMPVYSAAKAGMHAYSMAIRRQLSKTSIKVYEVVPPAVDTELNPAGRAKRGHFKAGLSATDFVAAVMKGLEADVPEIGFGMSAGFIRASRAELDQAFERMNGAM
ncbi:MAG TPA: SDR family oxidoreductase [Candidatus Cybelea sp.]|nr:SDR family oxidoreductase [Candidatus Cybelea sp.]